MANRIAFVAGSPGAGKTSVLRGIGNYNGAKVLNMGSMILELAVKKRLVKNRDEIRYMKSGNITGLRREVLEKIAKMDGNIIIDTHASVEEGGRYVPGLSMSDLKIIKGLRGFVYIDAFTEDIVRRRKMDRKRKRENERLELIDMQRLMNVSILSSCASYLNVPLYVVLNKQGELGSSLTQLRKHLAEIFGA